MHEQKATTLYRETFYLKTLALALQEAQSVSIHLHGKLMFCFLKAGAQETKHQNWVIITVLSVST